MHGCTYPNTVTGNCSCELGSVDVMLRRESFWTNNSSEFYNMESHYCLEATQELLYRVVDLQSIGGRCVSAYPGAHMGSGGGAHCSCMNGSTPTLIYFDESRLRRDQFEGVLICT